LRRSDYQEKPLSSGSRRAEVFYSRGKVLYEKATRKFGNNPNNRYHYGKISTHDEKIPNKLKKQLIS
jgi:hypothetical protein